METQTQTNSMDRVVVTVVGFWTKPICDESGVTIEESQEVVKFNPDTCIFKADTEEANHFIKVIAVLGQVDDEAMLLTAKSKTTSLFRPAFNSGGSALRLKAWSNITTGSKLSLEHKEWFYKVNKSTAVDLNDLV